MVSWLPTSIIIFCHYFNDYYHYSVGLRSTPPPKIKSCHTEGKRRENGREHGSGYDSLGFRVCGNGHHTNTFQVLFVLYVDYVFLCVYMSGWIRPFSINVIMYKLCILFYMYYIQLYIYVYMYDLIWAFGIQVMWLQILYKHYLGIIFLYLFIYLFMLVFMFTCIYLYTYINACIYVCILLYLYMYICLIIYDPLGVRVCGYRYYTNTI
jgi:hypothetical protein